MSDDEPPDEEPIVDPSVAAQMDLSRRQILAALGLGAFAGVSHVGAQVGDLEGPAPDDLHLGALSTSLTSLRKKPDIYTGPQSAFDKSELDAGEPAIVTDDFGLGVKGEDGTMEVPPLGSSSNPSPAVTTDRVHTDRRNADVVIAKNDNGIIEVDGPDGDISFTGEILDAVKAAIDAAPASNGWHIHIAPGQYDITGTYSDGFQLDWSKDGITISGAGYSTHLRVKDNTTDSTEGIRLITWTGTGTTIKNLRIDGNQQNNGGSNDGSTTDISGTADGMNLRPRGDDFIIRGVWSVNSTGDGVEPHADSNDNTKNGTIENCIFKDNYEQSVHYGGCENVTVQNNVLENEIRNAHVITVAASGTVTKGCEFVGNIVRGGQQEGVKVTPGSGKVEDFLVADNQFIGCALEGAVVTGDSANWDAQPEDIRFFDNTFKECKHGVRVNKGKKIRVRGNTSTRNDDRGFWIDASNSVTDVTVADNDITDNGVSTQTNALEVNPNSETVSDVRIYDNNILVNDSDADHGAGMKFPSASGSYDKVYVYDNHIDGATNTDISGGSRVAVFKGTATISSGSTSVSVTHNLGKDPGAEQIIAVPVGDLGSASYYYVDDGNIGSTSFTIKVDADPTQDVRFVWWMRPEA